MLAGAVLSREGAALALEGADLTLAGVAASRGEACLAPTVHGKLPYFLTIFAPVNCAIAESVACAAFMPSLKSLSENVVYRSVG